MRRGEGIGNLGWAPVAEWEEVARAAWPSRLPALLVAGAERVYPLTLVLGFGVLILAAWMRLPWLGLAAWSVGAVAEWLATPADSRVLRLLQLVGLGAQSRALGRSVFAFALVFASGVGPAAGLGYLAVVLLVQLAWTVQPVLATWLSRSAPPLLYLPKAKSQPEPFASHARCYARAVGTPGFLVGLEFMALAETLAQSQGLRSEPWDLFLIGIALAATGCYLAWTVSKALAVHRKQQAWGDGLIAELRQAAPSFLVYCSLGARQSRYIVNQWLPSLDALPRTGLLLVREASQLAPLAATTIPVVYGPTTRNVERLTLPSIRVVFYLAYGERNSTLLREPKLRHVMLAHGDSDKATSASALIRAFDETWVAGQAAIDRFAAAGIELAPDRFAIIGRPQTSELPVGPSGRTRKVVLYAPTFEGYYDTTAHSSLDVMGVELIRRLLSGHPQLQVRFRPHPASGVVRPSMLAAIADIETMLRAAGDPDLVVDDPGMSLNECLAGADILISDVSSVISDFLFTERPVIVCDPAGWSPEAFVAAYPSQASSYLLGPDLTGLEEILTAALGEDPLREARVAMKTHVLGNPDGGPQAAFAANLERLCAEG